jgi:TPR repeat protein
MAIRSNIFHVTLTAFLLLSASLIGGCTTAPRSEQPQDPQTILEEAHKAYANKEYQTVFQLLLPLAASGNDQAQYTVGYLYFHGLGVQKSETQAMSWIQRAAAQGNKKALSALK